MTCPIYLQSHLFDHSKQIQSHSCGYPIYLRSRVCDYMCLLAAPWDCSTRFRPRSRSSVEKKTAETHIFKAATNRTGCSFFFLLLFLCPEKRADENSCGGREGLRKILRVEKTFKEKSLRTEKGSRKTLDSGEKVKRNKIPCGGRRVHKKVAVGIGGLRESSCRRKEGSSKNLKVGKRRPYCGNLGQENSCGGKGLTKQMQ